MLKLDNHSAFKTKKIADVIKGDIIVNLGEVLEVEETVQHYQFVIYRLKEKQVHRFDKDGVLILF